MLLGDSSPFVAVTLVTLSVIVGKAVSAFLVDGMDIVESGDPRVSFAEGGKLKDFVGTLVGNFNFYEAATNTPLFLSGGKFWYASASTQTMDAFRGYFDFGDSPAKGDASRFTMAFIDDNPDAVNEITVKNENNSNVYDLQGRQVKDSQLKPGLYIRNGKKTVIR